ncbi:MAG: threonine--tRNA ligase [Clostridiales bacterium]|jgi:threonyl-tRNA synthetase|nr:threonine--tRNA ligase [Clostridiales bacterium]
MKITLKDNKIIDVTKGQTVAQVASSISESLCKSALIGLVDDKPVDLDYVLNRDCNLQVLTIKDSLGQKAFWHTATHILAQACTKLFKNAKLATGPATENGFFYDIEFENSITQEDLSKIENEMAKIVKADYAIKRTEVSRADALEQFKKSGQKYKVLLIDDIPKGEAISLYTQGDFVDLCEGPHLPRTGLVKHFKLTQLAGAYFKGDQSQKMLTRIYGIAYEKKQDLEQYLTNLEEAKKRDHQKLGRELGIFSTVECVGQGLPLFAPNGAKILQTLIRWVEDEEERRGYVLTRTPIMAKSDLYKISGHWDKYRDGMLVLGDSDSNYLAMRPMTCPFQFFIYKNGLHSYRDLPIRYAETSTLMRNEDSGEMHGLIRLKQFTLSDGHIICTPQQMEAEFKNAVELAYYLLDTLGLRQDVTFRFGKHDPNNLSKYIDNPTMWQTAETKMKEMLDALNLKYCETVGDAAFYGPKLDIQIRNVYGKEDTLITVQIDFALPERFDMEYTDADGIKKRPIVIHRSSLGCYERTLALLIEKYAGAFPTWLCPKQVIVMSLTDRTAMDADVIQKKLLSIGVRAVSDNRSEKIGYKIREAQLEKVPYMLIIGDKEKEQGVVAVRDRRQGDLGTMSFSHFEQKIVEEIKNKTI